MTIQEMIKYDIEHRSDLVLNYYNFITACRKLVEADYAMRESADWNATSLRATVDGFEVKDIFHFHYVMKTHLTATLCPDGRYRISFEKNTENYKPFEIYEYVDKDTYTEVYKKISDKNIEMPGRLI